MDEWESAPRLHDPWAIRVFVGVNFALALLCAVGVAVVATALVSFIASGGASADVPFWQGVAGVLFIMVVPALAGLGFVGASVGLYRRAPWGYVLHMGMAVLAACTCAGLVYAVPALVLGFRPEFRAALGIGRARGLGEPEGEAGAGPLAPWFPPAGDRLNWGDLVIALPMVWTIELMSGLVMVASSGADAAALMDMNPVVVLLLTLIGGAWSFFVVWYLACRRRGRSLVDGFRLHGVGGRALAKWLLAAIVLAAAGGLGSALLGSEESPLAQFVESPGGLAAILLVALIVPPFEEFYYRGFIFPILRDLVGARFAIAAVAVWFAAIHALQLHGDWWAISFIFGVGLLWTYLRHRYDSLLPSLVMHWVYNTTLVVFTLAGYFFME